MTAKPTVYVVGADKGGVGKTTVTRALLAYFEDHGIESKAFDTEEKPGVLARYHPEKTELVDLTKSDGQMKVFDNLSRAAVTVIDCKAALLTPTLELLRDIGFLEQVAAGKIEVVVLHVMGATKSSLEEIEKAASVLVGAKHFLVTNHINDTSYFGWDSDEAKAMLAKATGVLNIEKLDELAMEAVGQAEVGFNAFKANVEQHSFVLRGYVRHWLGKVFAEFNKVGPQ